MWQYFKWFAGQALRRTRSDFPAMPRELRDHAEFAAGRLHKAASEISGTMRKHQLKLADRQCRMSELSSRIQSLVVILCTSLYASRGNSELVRSAADGVCRTLTRRMTGERMSDRDFRHLTELGEAVAEARGELTKGVDTSPIMIPYPP
jgi:hypothetical protein